MNWNRDTKRRAEILWHNLVMDKDMGGIQRFDGLTPEHAQMLLDERFADPEDRQNDAPEFAEFVQFMREHPGFVAHGYAVSEKREDYRVTIEGLWHDGGSTPADRAAFTKFCRQADEFEVNEDTGAMRSWWD